MHAARRAAWDYIKPHLKSGLTIFDVCCGEPAWLMPHARDAGCRWVGIDQKISSDIPASHMHSSIPTADGGCMRITGHMDDFGVTLNNEFMRAFDLVVTVYGLQHIQGNEARAWLNLRPMLKPDGIFLYFGNHAVECYHNTSRQDPANVHSEQSFRGLALATGFEVTHYERYIYEPTPREGYAVNPLKPESLIHEANGFRATLRVRR